MLRKLFFFCLLLVGAVACIDPIDFKNDIQQEHLVVEANFTNLSDSSYIKLTYAVPYDYPFNKYERAASVYITSKEGEMIPYHHYQNGIYYPDNNRHGEIGHTYQLHIVANGNTYASVPVLLQQPVPVDSVYFDFAQEEVVEEGGKEKVLKEGYRVLVSYKDPADENNYYQWSFRNEYEVLTQPMDFVDNQCCLNPVPKPKRCCSTCWVYEQMQELHVKDDRLNNGQKVINERVLFIPFEQYLHIKYKLTIYQHTINEEAYKFFEVMEKQRQTKGTVFDPPPSEIKGNVYNEADEDDKVIGFFNAAGTSVKEVTIIRSQINSNFVPWVFPDDCRVIRGATTRRPTAW